MIRITIIIIMMEIMGSDFKNKDVDNDGFRFFLK